MEKFSVQELKEFLSTQLNGEFLGASLDIFERNRVSGKTFLQLDDEELRELFPLIGEPHQQLQATEAGTAGKGFPDIANVSCYKV